ncbi:MAG: helix-turn-helix domain-containing protein [Candidatus Parvarchaeota archaeon]
MAVINDLSGGMSLARICRAMGISRSSIYYRKADHTLNRKPRLSPGIEKEILSMAEKRTTYGYRRIWAILCN